jgi:hypothetical protein
MSIILQMAESRDDLLIARLSSIFFCSEERIIFISRWREAMRSLRFYRSSRSNRTRTSTSFSGKDGMNSLWFSTMLFVAFRISIATLYRIPSFKSLSRLSFSPFDLC